MAFPPTLKTGLEFESRSAAQEFIADSELSLPFFSRNSGG